METTHFSDWPVTGGFELRIRKNILKSGEKTKLWVVNIASGDELVPLLVTEAAEAELTALGNWKIVQGGGKIVANKSGKKGFASSAEYAAPSSVNGMMHVTITAEIEGFNRIPDPSAPGGFRNTGKMILLGRVIVSDNYLTGTLDGIPFGFFGEHVLATGINGLIVVRGADDSGEIQLSANANAAGSYPCGHLFSPGNGSVTVDPGSTSYGHSFIECGPAGEIRFSTSPVQITEWPAVGGNARGSFSGPVYLNDGNCGPRQKMLAVEFSVTRSS